MFMGTFNLHLISIYTSVLHIQLVRYMYIVPLRRSTCALYISVDFIEHYL